MDSSWDWLAGLADDGQTNAPYTVRFPGSLVGDRCLSNTLDAERARWMNFGFCPAMRV